MTALIVGVVALVGGFVFGVLFGRRNSKKVEVAVAEAQKVEAKVVAEVKKV